MEPTVEVLLEAAEGVYPVVLPHTDREASLVVVVHQSFHKHLLVGPAGAYLQPLKLKKLLEDSPLQLVPASISIWRPLSQKR